MKIDIKKYFDLIDTKIKTDKNYSGVFGVPRGGTLMALYLSTKRGLKLLSAPIKGCLIVDDLIDSGKTAEKYKDYDFQVLIDKRKMEKREWIEFWYENNKQDDENLITRILERIGENPSREGIINTPKRVVKMWKEIFRGYDNEQKPKITIFDNGSDGIIYDQMIVDKGYFFSHCEHHMVPFFGEYYFAYIPDKKILGISKVARIVDYYSAKLQIQERLVKDIVDEIEKVVKPVGIALIMKGRHLCKEMRGVKKYDAKMVTSEMRGVFRKDNKTREEFLRIIKI